MDDPARERALTRRRGSAPLIPDGLDATLVLVRHGESTFIVEGRFQGQADTPLTADRPAPGGARRRRASPRPHDAAGPAVPAGARSRSSTPRSRRTTADREAIERAHARRRLGATVARRPEPGLPRDRPGRVGGPPPRRDRARARATSSRPGAGAPLEAWAPGGESLPEVAARVRPALAGAPRAPRRRPARPARSTGRRSPGYGDAAPDQPWSIVVGHDGVFKVALLTLFDLPLERFWMWSMDLCGITRHRVPRPAGRSCARTT